MIATIFNENYNSYYDWQSHEINYELLKKRLISLKNDLGYSREFVDIMTKILKKDEHERYSIDQLDAKLRHKKSLRGRNSIGSLHLEQSPIPHRYNFEDESSLNFMGIEAVNGNKNYGPKGMGVGASGQRQQMPMMQAPPVVSKFNDGQKTQPNSHQNINARGYPQNPVNGNYSQRRKSSPQMQGGQRYRSPGKHPQGQMGYQNQPRQQRKATHHQQTPQGKTKPPNAGYTPQNQYNYNDKQNWTKNSNGSFNNPLRTTTGSNRNGALRGSGTSYPQKMMNNSRNGALRGSNGSFGTKGINGSAHNATIRGTKGSYGNTTVMNNSRNGALRGSQALRGSRNTVVPPLNTNTHRVSPSNALTFIDDEQHGPKFRGKSQNDTTWGI